jgi:hypothetical protein
LHPVKLAFGNPIYPPSTPHPGEVEYAEVTQELEQRVMNLWTELRGQDRQTRAHTAH